MLSFHFSALFAIGLLTEGEFTQLSRSRTALCRSQNRILQGRGLSLLTSDISSPLDAIRPPLYARGIPPPEHPRGDLAGVRVAGGFCDRTGAPFAVAWGLGRDGDAVSPVDRGRAAERTCVDAVYA